MASRLVEIFISLTVFTVSAVNSQSTGVPVMIWGNKVPYLPPAYAGHTTSQKEFTKNYVNEMIKPSHNVVTFVQDKLSVEDFTHLADVYNENSNGGILDKLKSLVEMNPSVHLPSVSQASSALDEMMRSFNGRVLQLQAPYSTSDLHLESNTANLIVVRLPSTVGTSEQQWTAFTQIDDIIGSVVNFLAQESKPYLAFYTAERPSMVQQVQDNHLGRHLMETAEENNATIVNDSCVLMYMQQLSLILTTPTQDNKVDKKVYPLPKLTNVKTSCNSNSGIVTLFYDTGLSQDLENVNVTMELKTAKGYWNISNMSLKASIKNPSDSIDAEMNINIFAPQKYSYHCSDLGVGMNTNVSTKDSSTKSDVTPSLQFQEFQLQYSKNVTMTKFGRANDCVGFFNATIWMGLVCTLVLGLILAFGLCMLSTIHTMDRFDDPKGKTITVNVND